MDGGAAAFAAEHRTAAQLRSKPTRDDSNTAEEATLSQCNVSKLR
jgi:hypothetical protein